MSITKKLGNAVTTTGDSDNEDNFIRKIKHFYDQIRNLIKLRLEIFNLRQ